MVSTNYEIFKFYPFNRSINRFNVEKIKRNILKFGYLPAKEIMVDSEFFIIEGQHRFTACKELDLPIQYQLYEGDADKQEVVLACNNSQLTWRLQCYIESHANNGAECYKELLEFGQLYKLATSNNIIVFIKNKGHQNAPNIRKGVSFERNPNAHKIVFTLQSLKGLSFWNERNFVAAIRILYDKCNDGQIKKVVENCMVIKKQADTINYLNVFENIINKGAKNKIAL